MLILIRSFSRGFFPGKSQRSSANIDRDHNTDTIGDDLFQDAVTVSYDTTREDLNYAFNYRYYSGTEIVMAPLLFCRTDQAEKLPAGFISLPLKASGDLSQLRVSELNCIEYNDVP
jgi:hypothetical protein